MRSTALRALGLIGFGLGPAILLAGCGPDESGARTTLNSIQPSSYVVRAPVTTTTTVADDAGAELDDDNRSTVPQEYTVQAGDAVSVIANRFGITMDELANFNEWPDGIFQAIFPGDVIGIPPGALVPGATATDPGNGDTDTDGDVTPGTVTQTTLPGGDGECVPGEHTIVENDNPTRVAAAYDITVAELEAANAGNPAYQQFIPGQQLRIPCADDD